jgi:hypothetical protein
MEQDGAGKVGRTLENGGQERRIEMMFPHPPAHHGALETQIADTALKLERGLIRAGHRQRGEPLKTRGMTRDRLGNGIVDAAGQIDTPGAKVMQAGGGERKNLHIQPVSSISAMRSPARSSSRLPRAPP